MESTQKQEQKFNPLFVYEPLYNEEARKQKCTNADYCDTITLIKNFQLPIPENFDSLFESFNAYKDLENWRRNYIITKLKEIELRSNYVKDIQENTDKNNKSYIGFNFHSNH